MQIFFDQAYRLEKNKCCSEIFRLHEYFSSNIYSETLPENGVVEKITYQQYMNGCELFRNRISGYFIDKPKGGFVGLKLSNSAEWGMVFWGLLMSGFRPLILDFALGTPETVCLLKEVDAVALISEKPEEAGVDCITLDDIRNSVSGRVFESDWADEVAFCSSGTENRTICVFDGVALSNQILAALCMPEYTDDIMYRNKFGQIKNLAMLPFFHIFGFVAVFLWYTFFGRTLVFVKELKIDSILTACRTCKVSHIFAVPAVWDGIARGLENIAVQNGPGAKVLRTLIDWASKISDTNSLIAKPRMSGFVLKQVRNRLFGNNVRFCISGGSFLSKKTLGIINGIGYNLYNGYGLTETGITSVCLDRNMYDRVDGNVGFPLDGIEYSIDGQTGELQIQSDYLAGYYISEGKRYDLCNPYKTGDIAKKNDSGRYYILGKNKDIIINSSGENIIPYEIESKLYPLGDIKDYVVLGLDIGDKKDQVSLVVSVEGRLKPEEIKAITDRVNEVNETLPLYKKIVEILVTEAKIPVTNTRKIKRQNLKKLAGSMPAMFVSIKNYLYSDTKEIDCDEKILAEVVSVAAEVLSLNAADINASAHFIYDLGGDSLSYSSFVAMLEKKFDMKIPLTDLSRCNTIYDFVSYIENTREERI